MLCSIHLLFSGDQVLLAKSEIGLKFKLLVFNLNIIVYRFV
jgi:hypothetical protein